MALDNPYAAEPLIITRIRDNIPELKTVAGGEIIAQKKDIVSLTDGVFVIPGPIDALRVSGGSVSVECTWNVVAAVKHPYDILDAQTTALKGGDITGQIIRLLHNWEPPGGDFMKMHFAGFGGAYYGAGYGEFPLFFNVETVFKGA